MNYTQHSWQNAKNKLLGAGAEMGKTNEWGEYIKHIF